MKNYNYKILDCTELVNADKIDSVPHFKTLCRRQPNVYVLSPKTFKEYSETVETYIVGRINKHKFKSNNNSEKTALLELQNGSAKEYRIKPDASRHTYGYAWVGQWNFVRVTTFNPLWLIVPLIIAVLFIFLFSNCSNDIAPLFKPNSSDITDVQTASDILEEPLCYYRAFPEYTAINSETSSVNLMNLNENADTWYIAYEVYVDDKLQELTEKDGAFELAGAADLTLLSDDDKSNDPKISTGVIEPGKQVAVNLLSLSSGNHSLKVLATDYRYAEMTEYFENVDNYSVQKLEQLEEEAKMPLTHTLETTLIVEK